MTFLIWLHKYNSANWKIKLLKLSKVSRNDNQGNRREKDKKMVKTVHLFS